MTLAISLILIISAAFQLYSVVRLHYQITKIENKILSHQTALIKQQNEICELLNTANSYLSKIAGTKNTNPTRGVRGSPPKIKQNFEHKFV